ncbi:MAG: glycosyltransferase [Acidobacteria bacterium]|nr:glycosyltransferase [Acidobacteriota bacterium]
MQRKLFSIITPTLNCGRKIVATTESVLSQDRDLFEYIVIDGGSTDGTLEAARRYGAELRLVSEKDDGVYAALNKGIDMATGKYLYFLGAGDQLKENVLAGVKDLLPDGELNFVYGDAYYVNRGGYLAGEFGKSELRVRNICHQAVFYERTIFDLLGKYDPRYPLNADYVLNLKCFADSRIRRRYIGRVIADYEGGGLSDLSEDLAFKKDFPRLVRSHLGEWQYVLQKRDALRLALYLSKQKLSRRLRRRAGGRRAGPAD